MNDDKTGYESECSEMSDDDEYKINTSTNKKPIITDKARKRFASNFKTSNKKQRQRINNNYNGTTKKV